MNKRNKLRSVEVKNKQYKWKIFNETVGFSVKIWTDHKLLNEVWFVSKPKSDFNNKFISKMIINEKLT